MLDRPTASWPEIVAREAIRASWEVTQKKYNVDMCAKMAGKRTFRAMGGNTGVLGEGRKDYNVNPITQSASE